MSLTNFPNGITSFGCPILPAAIPEVVTGSVFFVNSGTGSDSGGMGHTPGQPFATIGHAISRCTANKGDTIYIMEGHAETYSKASGVDLNKAGVKIIGLGAGNKRPTITLDTVTTATIAVTAANITVRNVIFTANFADIVTLFALTTANNFRVEGCYFKATASAMNFLSIFTTNATSAAADGLTIRGCKWIEPDTATLHLVNMAGTNADVTIDGNFVQLGVLNNKAALLNVANTKIVTNLQMVNNRVFRLNTDTATGGILFHTNGSTNSGIVAHNFAQHADSAGELLITASSGLGTFQNYASGVAGLSGYLLPAADG